jgi:hypothetical protein
MYGAGAKEDCGQGFGISFQEVPFVQQKTIWLNAVNNKTRLVRQGNWIAAGHAVSFNEFFCLGSLGDTEGEASIREKFLFILGSNKPGHFAHEVDPAFGA